MAQFTSRPETPQDWGGLPAEPLGPSHPTDLQPTAANTDLFGTPLSSAGIELAIPLPQTTTTDDTEPS